MRLLLLLIPIAWVGCTYEAEVPEVEVVPLTPWEAPETYMVYQASDSIVCDGRLDEASWSNAPYSKPFIDIEGAHMPAPTYHTQVKMLWDNNYLYIAAVMEEPHVWASLTTPDAIIYRDNDFEVFIDPDGDTHNYLEIEVNALNTIFDLMLVKPYRNGGPMVMDWDVEGLRCGIHINGTLNNPTDVDSTWQVEMAIPLLSLVHHYRPKLPQPGTQWHINFSRVQWDTDVVDGQYIVRTDTAGKRLPEHNWVWSPQGLINMHYPEKWGIILFSNYQEAHGREELIHLQQEEVKWALRQLYYRQNDYFKAHKTYASTLGDLGLDEVQCGGKTWATNISTNGGSYEITATTDSTVWHINNESRIWMTRQ